MGQIVDYLLFALGLAIGVLTAIKIWVPLIYGLPRTILWSARRWTRWVSVPARCLVPLAWLAGLAVIVVAFGFALSETTRRILLDPAVHAGALVGIVFALLQADMSITGKHRVAEEFSRFVTRFLTGTGRERVAGVA